MQAHQHTPCRTKQGLEANDFGVHIPVRANSAWQASVAATCKQTDDCVLQCSERGKQQSTGADGVDMKPLYRTDLKHLLVHHRQCKDRSDRARISKLTWSQAQLRQHMRSRRNHRLNCILTEFRDLGRIEAVRHDPIQYRKSSPDGPSTQDFSDKDWRTELLCNTRVCVGTSVSGRAVQLHRLDRF